MPRYYFRIPQGGFSGTSELEAEFTDENAAWAELANVGGDLLGSIARKLKPNGNWQIEILDEGKKPKYRISLFAETLDKKPLRLSDIDQPEPLVSE
jgi:hypothetical protein